MLGGVANPGTYPLTERNLPLTSLIASAGGVSEALVYPRVQITRGSQVFRRSLAYVLDAPSHDPALQGGDRVVIEEDPRSFMALGATGRQEVITFDDEKVTALRAISLMGGIDDTRADPKGLLVLRRYPESALGRPGGPTNRRVVFAFDLTNADSLFSADEFTIIDDDVVLATQAPATTTRRVLSLFGAVIGVSDSAASL
jgi:polysaccharide biosynthesis/export protein